MRWLLILLLLWATPAEAVLRQVIIAGNNNDIHTTNTEYAMFGGGNSFNSTESNRENVIPFDGVLTDLRVQLDQAPNTGNDAAFMVRIDGADSSPALACTIEDAATTCQDTDTALAVTAGELISLEHDPLSSPDVSDAIWSVKFYGGARTSIFLSGTANNNLDTVNDEYLPIIGARGTTTDEREIVFPIAGTLKSLYVDVETAPDTGAGTQTWDFTLRLNNTNQSMTCQISETATTCNDTSNEVSVSAGDSSAWFIQPSASAPTASVARIGVAFEATTDGEFAQISVNGGLATVDEYGYPNNSGQSYSTTETTRVNLTDVMTIQNLYVEMGTAPDNGGGTQTRTFHLRLDQAASSPTLSCSISETDTTCNASATVSISADQEMNILNEVSAGTPATAGSVGVGFSSLISPRRVWVVSKLEEDDENLLLRDR